MEFKDRAVIVTGASSGIGLETAKFLSARGSKLALAARSKQKLEELTRTLPSSFSIPTDMTKIDEVREMVRHAAEHFGRVDALVNCAGQGYDAPVEKTDIATLRYIYDLYVVGPLVAMQEVIPLMRRQGGGSIVNVSSGLALAPLPNMSPYSSTERALAAISLAAREELKKDKIVVSVVYPYVTTTDFEKNTIKHSVPEAQGELPFPPDTAEFAAKRVLEALEGGEAEIFAHDWMKTMGKGNPTG